jgi:WD40 repeat protein
VLKSVAFAGPDRLLVASGEGMLVVHERVGERWKAARTLRGAPMMELSNGVTASPDNRIAYVVSRDQTLRAFDLDSSAELATGLAHVRGVKTVHASPSGQFVATGSYDRTVMIWSASDLTLKLPPIRLACSGISGVRWLGDRLFACSFDGFVFAVDAASGRMLWSRSAADTSEGN